MVWGVAIRHDVFGKRCVLCGHCGSQRRSLAVLVFGMKIFPLAFLFLPVVSLATETAQFDSRASERFARLALACVEKQYPNKISHVLNSEADVAAP